MMKGHNDPFERPPTMGKRECCIPFTASSVLAADRIAYLYV